MDADDCRNDNDIPTAEELESYYVMLESGTIPQLSWKCNGRHLPMSETAERANKVEQDVKTTAIEIQESVKNDFDFSDDVSAQPQMRQMRGQNSTPKSAKKKTANFAGVLEVLKKKTAEG